MANIALRLKIKRFIVEQIWVYLIVICSIFLCSWIFHKWIEGIIFCVAHITIRRAFDKQFHFNKTAYCLMLTLGVIWFSIPITPSITVSLLGSIPVAFGICFIGFLAQDRVDLMKEIKRLDEYSTQLVMSIAHKDIYAMDEDELYEHCRNCGLDEEDCKIAYFVVIERLKGKELYEALPYSQATIKRKRLRILNTIKKNTTTYRK